MSSRYAAPELGISGAVWRNWVRLGVPVDRAQDVADMLGLPVSVLWPQLEQPKSSRVKPPKPVGLYQCSICGHRAGSRAELARHRRDEDHYDEDEDAA